MLRDLKHALRYLRRNKVFSAIIIVLLATGVGANTLVFSFINTLVLKPLPARDPQSLFMLEGNVPQQVRPDTSFSYRHFEQLSKRTDLFSAVIAEQQWSESSVVPLDEAGGGIRPVMTQIVSPNYFTELGIHAALGRVLMASDATATGSIPVNLSYQFWQSDFGGEPDVIGRTIRLNKHPFLVVGVLPREFHSLDIERAPDVRVPISAAPVLTGRNVEDSCAYCDAEGFHLIARLRRGLSAAQCAAAISAPIKALEEWEVHRWDRMRYDHWDKNFAAAQLDHVRETRFTWVSVAHGISQMRTQFSQALDLLMGAVAFLLIAVCANLSGLLLAKSQERRKEIAVRLSLGATSRQLLRRMMVENLLLAIPGSLLGIGLCFALAPVLLHLIPAARSVDQYASPQILSVTPDLRVLLFTLAVSVASIFLFGSIPAWRATNVDLNSEIKGVAASQSRGFGGLGPIALQVAISVVLLSGGLLMLRTYWNLEALNPGFDRAHVASFTLDLKDSGYSGAQKATFLKQLEPRVRDLPGIRAVAFANRGLMRGAGIKATVAPQGVVLPRDTFMNASVNTVSPSYFEALGIPMLAGRPLMNADLGATPARIVVNRAFADLLFPHQNPLGKAVVQGTDGRKPPNAVIVGVVGTAKYRSMREADPPTSYAIFSPQDSYTVVLYIRTYGNPSHVIHAVRSAIRSLDPAVPILEVATLEQEVQNSLWQERLTAVLFSFFCVTSLFLAGIGIYGTLAYSVARRTRELGIRMALGAQLVHLMNAICSRLFIAVLLGATAGICASLLLLGVTRRLLFGVSPLDLRSLLLSLAFILICATLAAVFPVWRAAQTDAARALRHE